MDGRLKGGGVSLVMQSLKSSPMAHEAEEYPAMSESTTDIRIVPLPNGQDVLTEILRDGARHRAIRGSRPVSTTPGGSGRS